MACPIGSRLHRLYRRGMFVFFWSHVYDVLRNGFITNSLTRCPIHQKNSRSHLQVTAFGRELKRKFLLQNDVCDLPEVVRRYLIRDDIVMKTEMPIDKVA